MARQDYFTHFEQSQLEGGVKMGDPREKPPDHPQVELCLSRMWPELDLNPQRWDEERFRALKISILNHSAMRAALSQHLLHFDDKVGILRHELNLFIIVTLTNV